MITNGMKRGFDIDIIDIESQECTENPSERSAYSNSRSKPEMTMDMVFRKMEKEGDFPSFSNQIIEINKVLNLKYASAKDIANVLMKDFALCNKLIKLVNSSFYGVFGRGGVSSVEEAMIILGADQVQQAAASLMLFEHMQKSSRNEELKQIALKTLMSGLIAKELAMAKRISNSDEFLICAMFHRLGENLMAYYFPEQRETIIQFAKRNKMSYENAFRLFLGFSSQELGVGIAAKWGLPENIRLSMQTKKPEKPSLAAVKLSRVQQLGTVALLSNVICDIRFQITDPSKRDKIIGSLIQLYRGRYDTVVDTINILLTKVIKNIKSNSSYLDINTDECRVLFDEPSS